MSWTPHLGAQTEFLMRNEFEVLGGGSAGGGKSDCLVAGLTRDIDKPRYHGLIARRTFPQLQEIIDRCYQIYSQMGGVYRTGEKRWTFPSGAKIDLGHMQHEDDKYNYLGREFHKIGIDELTQFTETQYTYLFSRMRTTDPGITPQIISTTNPGGVGHYFVRNRFINVTEPLRTFIDPKTGLNRVFVPMTLADNPSLVENDPDYVARLMSLPEIEKRRLLDGIWDDFEGQVFTELSSRVHACEPFDIPPEWERFCVLDWGYSSPFCVLWFAVDYDGVMYVYREWYGCRKEEEGIHEGADEGLKMVAYEVARGIREREQGEKIRMRIADPSIFHKRPGYRSQEARGLTIHDDFRDEGLYFIEADNDRLQGKMQVHKRLKLIEEVDTETGEVISERPMVQIFNTCKGFWRTMPEIREDPKRPEDVDTKQEDHAYDALRYACISRPLLPKRYSSGPAPNSFQAERTKLIRAKQFARRHGVSLPEAYRRIR